MMILTAAWITPKLASLWILLRSDCMMCVNSLWDARIIGTKELQIIFLISIENNILTTTPNKFPWNAERTFKSQDQRLVYSLIKVNAH